MKISIVIPVFNEANSLEELFGELISVMDSEDYDYELIAIDDGSHDGSASLIRETARKNKHIKFIRFRTNTGQTAAIRAGVHYATGSVIIPMDSDLENDPRDIPRLVRKLSEGYDVVSGWRKHRWEKQYLTRRLPSTLANWLISKLTGLHLHDYGCMLKAYKSEVIKEITLYGEMHRFIPAYASWRGASVAEIEVNHRVRKHGSSKYGLSRTFRVLLDLLLIKFLHKYLHRPIHFFGMAGFLSLGLSFFAGAFALVLKFWYSVSLISTPLPTLSTLLAIVAVQLIGMGILAEILMRIYFESQNKTPYSVAETVNL